MAVAMYMIEVRPFEDDVHQGLETLNEICLIMTICTLTGMTDAFEEGSRNLNG